MKRHVNYLLGVAGRIEAGDRMDRVESNHSLDWETKSLKTTI